MQVCDIMSFCLQVCHPTSPTMLLDQLTRAGSFTASEKSPAIADLQDHIAAHTLKRHVRPFSTQNCADSEIQERRRI